MCISTQIFPVISSFPSDRFEIQNITKSLSSETSAGFDQIPCHILNDDSNVISDCLSNIINDSFSSGYFLDSLKEENVIPLYKRKGIKQISIITAMCHSCLHFLKSIYQSYF